MTRRLPPVRRLVVKVGSAALIGPDGEVSARRLAKVVRDVSDAARGRGCVLVSSGAIATGLTPLGLARRPRDMPTLQAAAAVGQGRLVAGYARLFARRGLVVAQVLLTQDDFVRRRHYVNARNTLERLLKAGAIPVVNENDTIGTEEIRFGDNDRLAALTAVMLGADLLVLLSDVDGIYTKDPGRKGAALLEEVADLSAIEAGATRSGLGSGGMASKVEAARIATAAGVGVVVAGAARRDVVARVLAGEPEGTWLPPSGGKRPSRKAWLAFVSGLRGRIVVDAGAERAVREAGRSLLAAGVTGVEGDFEAGDTVEVAGPGGTVFARGVTNHNSRELPALAGTRGGESPVIHRDELVLLD
ncbi:MAG TPA: glutamate 5-kinase [Actinomycetota bacterium]